MDSEIVDAVIDWDSAPFSGGYKGLQELADGEFSGAITEGTAWAFMLNGRVIGIEAGSMSSFERADGTAYTAPTPALPLLYAMQMRGEKQTQYYTNEKPISEADTTLSSGGFTGYIELSENVLSGDYYTVYYGGKSMSVAFVGNSRKLLTDEEAFERADDEVGIYTVYAADLEVIDIPERAGSSKPADEEATETTDDGESHAAESTPSTTDASTADAETDATTEHTGRPAATDDTASQPSASTPSPPAASEASRSAATASSDGGASAESSADHQSRTDSTASTQSAGSSSDGVFSDEAKWRNSKSIPSLDPSDDPKRTEKKRTSPSKTQSTSQSSIRSLSRGQLQKRLKRAEQIMQKAETQHEQLVEERETLKAERDETQAELDAVRAKLSEAEAEIERL